MTSNERMIKVELFHFGIRRLLRRHALCHSCPNEHFKWNSNGTQMKAKWPTLNNPNGRLVPDSLYLAPSSEENCDILPLLQLLQ